MFIHIAKARGYKDGWPSYQYKKVRHCTRHFEYPREPPLLCAHFRSRGKFD